MPWLKPETCLRWIRSNGLLLFLLAVCAVRLWFMVLPSSFWTDETGTVFVVKLAGDASLDAAPQVPASVYYVLPRAADRLFGFSEISYRIPSVLLMAIAIFFIARIAARLIDRDAAWFAAFLCFAVGDLNYYAADARPYPLGICVAAAAIFFLIQWLDTRRWTAALLFLVLAAILWRVQLVFWAFYPVFAIYTLVRLLRGTTALGWARALLVYVALAAALLPVAFQALHLLQTATAHVIFSVPGFGRLLSAIRWKPVAWCLAIAFPAAWWSKWSRHRPVTFDSGVLIVAWWLWMPLCLWAWSVLSGTVLFVPRYFSLALPGAALTATAVIATILPRRLWKHAAAVAAVLALAMEGHWSTRWPAHTGDNWRDGARTERIAARDPETPVIAVSPFIEAQPPVWTPDYYLPGFLYAPEFAYPLSGHIYPFPFVLSANAERYAADLLRDTLVKQPRFIVYGGGRFAMHWVIWFAGRPELAGWSYRVNRASAIETVVFEKAG